MATFVIDGFCKAEENPFGPVQLYVAPLTATVERLSVVPVHTGLLDAGDGVTGVALTVAFTVAALLVQPATVAVTE